MNRGQHGLSINFSKDDQARFNFIVGARQFVLGETTEQLADVYKRVVEPEYLAAEGELPTDSLEVLKALKPNRYYQLWANLRTAVQKLVWRSPMDEVVRQRDWLRQTAKILIESRDKAQGTLQLDPDLEMPNSNKLDVHLQPGGYWKEYGEGDVTVPAAYDNAWGNFGVGLVGQYGEAVGASISGYFKYRFPDFKPMRILELGVSLGHSTLPWAQRYPDSEYHCIDVSAPMLRYGLARAQSLGVTLHMHQKDAENMNFEPESFDLVLSHMFLHEIPRKVIRKVFKQAHDLLKPGGMMLHMEFPPSRYKEPFDCLAHGDWDSLHIKEPYLKPFRDMNTRNECADAGFDTADYFEFVTPNVGVKGEESVKNGQDLSSGVGEIDPGSFGKLDSNGMWYAFGAKKQESA